MTRHLTVEQALGIARAAVGGPVEVRDVGLLGSAIHRPRADPEDDDAYDLVVAVASGALDDVHGIAARLDAFVRPPADR